MQLKTYQKNTLRIVSDYLELLSEWRKKAIDNPDFEVDYPAKAWEKLGKKDLYLPKKNGLGEPLPNFCLKIPTGGGKTLLAVEMIGLINQIYLNKRMDWCFGLCQLDKFIAKLYKILRIKTTLIASILIL